MRTGGTAELLDFIGLEQGDQIVAWMANDAGISSLAAFMPTSSQYPNRSHISRQ
jgi:hypothetical protein